MSYDVDRLQRDIAQVQHEEAGFGSGRLVAENLILTAAHTLWNEEKGTGPFLKDWQVRLARDRRADGWPFRRGNSVVWYDQARDLSLIKIADSDGGALCPELRLRVVAVTRSNSHSVEARGYPRASKQVEGKRELTHAFGRLTAGQRDKPLCFGVDTCDLPNEPHADWPGISGSAVLLRDGHDPDEVCVYGVVQAVPKNFSGQLTVARLADAWNDTVFRRLLVAAGAPDKDTEDPSWDDVGSANDGIRALRKLIRDVPAAADAVSRSKEAIENASRKIENLELFKEIHDALHTIEFECLRPLQGEDFTRLARHHKIKFVGERRKILESIKKRDLPPVLNDDLKDGLESTAAAFQAAVDTPTDATRAVVLSELDGLLARVSPQLDTAISMTAAELKLDHIIALMATVQGCLPAAAEPTFENTVQDFVRGIDALRAMRNELARRVSEHGHLQRLDSKLRTMCAGGLAPGTLAKEWQRVKRLRSELMPPFSMELDEADADLKASESDIEAAVARGDEHKALDLLHAYFASASSVFRNVDSRLKEFTLELSRLSPSLRAILSESKDGGGE